MKKKTRDLIAIYLELIKEEEEVNKDLVDTF